jgi:excisionase family DNA binding protein
LSFDPHAEPATKSVTKSETSWLSVHEASRMTGVSASTLRRWADAGKVAAQRTLGGHRRFSREAILTVARADALERHGQAPPTVTPTVAIVDARELAHQPWHMKLGVRPETSRMRGLGQRLLGLLIQHVDSQEHDSHYIGEARAVGIRYGAEACGAAVSLHDAVQAFLFFRSACSQWAIPEAIAAQPSDLMAVAALHERIDHFMSAVLLGVVAGYEDERKAP